MEQRKINQFSDLSNRVENDLQKGSNELLNQIKSYNTLDKKISYIQSLNLKNEIEYQLILNGIIYGMLFDENMNMDSYFRLLFAINYDGYKTFFKILLDVLDFSKLKLEKYEKIYQIFERFIKINIDRKSLIEMLILICRNIYPGIDLINSIISYNNNINNNNLNNNNQNTNPNNEENFSNNYFYTFLIFIKSNLNFILDNDITLNIKINLTGLIFIKILRLFGETFTFHHIYKLNNNDNSTDSNINATINEIAKTYQKVGFNDQTKKFIGEIYELQVYILTKIYQEKKEKIFEIGRELIRIIIPLGQSNIEIINTIISDLLNNNYYEKILYMPYPQPGINIYSRINIPPIMERMITYILTNVKRASLTYKYYVNWMYREFKIEGIGNTILVDLTRFIMTNYADFYRKNNNNDTLPRWLILSYIFQHVKNQIISSEIKQVLFMDLILFDKERDHFLSVEPSIFSIITNMKEFPAISEELVEFLESYSKHFDNNKDNIQKRINSICDAFRIFEISNNNLTDIEKSIKESGMEEKFKNMLINLIKNENWINSNKANYKNNNYNNKPKEINENQNNIELKNNKIRNNIYINDANNNNDVIINTNSVVLSQLNENEQNKNKIKKEKSKKNNQQISDNKNKEINIEIIIPKEINTYIQKNILKNFLKERNQKNFHNLLNDLCNYNIKTFGDTDSSLKNLDSSYQSLCENFANFFVKIFQVELELNNFYNLGLLQNGNDKYNKNVYKYIFDFTFEKNDDNKIFSFMADLINKIIEKYQFFIIHLMSYVFSNIINSNKNKNNNYNGINFFNQLNHKDIASIRKKLNCFFLQCEENFMMFSIRDFFKYGGVQLFNKEFLDEENLIFKIIKNCDLNCINTIKMSLINNKFILIDKTFEYFYKNSFAFPPSEKNIFWNLILAQGNIPSLNLENFLKLSINILNNPPTNPLTNEEIKIDFDEFFVKIINSILNLFKKEINEDIKMEGFDKLSKKCIYMFNFNSFLKRYIYQMIDSFFENYFMNIDDRKKVFNFMTQQYFKENNKNINNLRNFAEILNYFFNKNNNGEKNNNIDWISDDIKTLLNNIIKTINLLSNS